MAKVREMGIRIGRLEPGRNNCITDVPGVAVGHVTLDHPLEGEEYACTGVTGILPHRGNLFREKVTGAAHVFNGFGKTTGLVQVEELGAIEGPILLTNTFSVPAAAQGGLEYMLERTPEIGETTGTINLVTAECNDMYLNSIRRMVLTPAHAQEALENASEQPAPEGAVGAGKGMTCFGYKGGIGTSSRQVEGEEKGYTLGVLVLSNFGEREDFRDWQYRWAPAGEARGNPVEQPPQGSVIVVLATDAPLSSRQLKRVCKRCGAGLARTGNNFANGSGDIAIGFANGVRIPHSGPGSAFTPLHDAGDCMGRLFLAAAEATEEAVLNSLAQAGTTRGRKGRTVERYPGWRE